MGAGGGGGQDDAKMIVEALELIVSSHVQDGAATLDSSVLADEVRLLYLETTGVDALASRLSKAR
jgi:hypothetical protein